MSHSLPSNSPLRVRAISQLETQPIDWLWRWWLAFGKLAILDGDPDLGKSLLTLDLCARLSTGRPFPDGSPSPGPAASLILNGEDGARDTIRPRLQALGADLDRIFIPDPEDLDLEEPLRFPTHLGALDKVLRETQARFVVIDPIMAFLDQTILGSSDQGVRRVLTPLAGLAARHRCVIQMVRHLNKRAAGPSLYRGAGSIGMVGACRSASLVASDPRTPGQCVLAQVKNNLAPRQPSLAYAVVSQPGDLPLLTWRGPAAWTADELVSGYTRSLSLESPRDRASDFLAGFLDEGPRTSREVWESAREQGLTERTLRRAKQDLNIRSQRVWEGSRLLSFWLLPHQRLPNLAATAEDDCDLEPWLAPLREKYPPSTPLDEL